jgi:hypothetical protein
LEELESMSRGYKASIDSNDQWLDRAGVLIVFVYCLAAVAPIMAAAGFLLIRVGFWAAG